MAILSSCGPSPAAAHKLIALGAALILPILGYRLATKLSEITGNTGIDDVKQYFKKSDA
jgi:hypothetical protein